MSATNQNAQIASTKEHGHFLNMPLHVANLVLEKLELTDLLTTQKVCRGLRAAVDKFGVFFDAITFYTTEEGHIEMDLIGFEIRYANADGGGTTVTYNDEPCRRIEGEYFVELAFTDLKIFMKHTSIFYISNNRKDNCKIIESFMDFLKSEKCIHVEEVGLDFSFNDVLNILPYFDAQTLESISLTDPGSLDHFETLTQLEHWKNGKQFDLSDVKFDSNKLESLFHFEEIIIELDEFSVQSAVQIRDDLMRRSRFQSLHIVEIKILNPIEIAKVFKPDYVGGNEYKFEYSNDDKKFSIECKVYSNLSFLYIRALKTI